MSSKASPAVLPDPKRPRLLAPGDESSPTPSVPSVASNGLARANYTGRAPAHAPAPSRVPARYERASYPATQRDPASQRVQGSLAQSSSASRTPTTSTATFPPPPSSSTSSSALPPARKSGLPFTDMDDIEIATYLRAALPDTVIAALMERTPQEIQTRISLLIRRHEHGMAKGPQMRPPYTAEDYEQLLRMHRNGASAERIALVLDRSTSSVMSHFMKYKPIWNAAGERVEAPTLLRDNKIDHDERIRTELAGPAAALAAQIAQARLVSDATRPPPPPTQSKLPTACANPPLAETTKPAGMPTPPLAQVSLAQPPLASDASGIPNVPAVLPSRSDNSTRSVPDSLVPHHAGHLDHLPPWHDEHYEQAMSGLKRFLRLVKGSRSSRTRSAYDT